MPIDSTSFRTDLQTDAPVLPGDLPITNPEFYKDLQVPQTVLQDRKLLGQFFSIQSKRLNSLEHMEKVKTLPGEIHDFDEIALELESFEPTTAEEMESLDALYREIRSEFDGGMMGIQSGEGDVDDLIQRANQYAQQHPASASDMNLGSPDLFDQIFMQEVSKNRAERDEMYRKLLLAAKDPETAVLIITQKMTELGGEQLGRLMPAYRFQLDKLDQSVAKMNLSGATNAQIAAQNAEVAKATSYMGMTTFMIQSVKGKLDGYQNTAKSVLDTIQSARQQIITNLKG